MSNTPQNIYGINNSADAYYGTLFSHLSYGMGEGNGVNSATTPNAENAAAAAAAAALAAVASGRNDWSNTDAYNAVSNMMNNMRTHPSMTACSNSGDLSESCNIPSSSLSSPYAATLLAAVAAAAAAAYPLPQGAANAVSGQTGRSFLPNPSMNNRAADFTTMYFGSSARPSVTNANQLNGLLGNLPNWPFTVPPTHYPNSSFIDRPTGAVVPYEGWASSNGQQLTLSPCGENDTINHFGQGPSEANMSSKDPHTYYTSSNMGDTVFAAPACYSQQQQQGTTEDPGVSFIYHHPNSKPAYPFSSQGTQSHLVNGLPGSAANMLDPYASVNQCQTISQHLIDEFGRLNVGCGVEAATCSDSGLNQLHVPFYETSVVGNGSNVQLHNASVTQWSHMKENNRIGNSMCSMDKSDNISRSQSNPSSYPASRLSTSASNRPAPSVIATSVNSSPRTKTWANIAGQPPKGSAAVIQNSVGWSAKRSHPHNPTAANRSFQPSTGNYSVGRANSLMANASCNNGHLTQQDRVNTGDQSGNGRSLAESNSELKSTSNNGNHSANNSTSLLTSDGSAQAFQRESEALHQRLAKVINPNDFDTHIEKARFFVIKSFSEDDIHRSIKYSIWCSTELGNKKLDTAFAEANHAYPIYLFFSVNGSGHFCGMAEMVSRVDYNARASVWAQDKWQGKFSVRWIFVKDVPNTALRHIRIETNDNKPVTHSRDTTELPLERGKQVMEVLATYSHTLSIFDDFFYYDQRERQEGFRRKEFNTRRG